MLPVVAGKGLALVAAETVGQNLATLKHHLCNFN